jgi:hypothetical protein
MKKVLLIAIVALGLGSCKKQTIEPTFPVHSTRPNERAVIIVNPNKQLVLVTYMPSILSLVQPNVVYNREIRSWSNIIPDGNMTKGDEIVFTHSTSNVKIYVDTDLNQATGRLFNYTNEDGKFILSTYDYVLEVTPQNRFYKIK